MVGQHPTFEALGRPGTDKVTASVAECRWQAPLCAALSGVPSHHPCPSPSPPTTENGPGTGPADIVGSNFCTHFLVAS
eukprot:COSAG03_NODE_3117_length_2205_cov_2.890313_1_plen_77_part_10